MRLSDAEREVLYEQLKRHAATGRLSIDELERRIETVAAAATREDAASALADLPPLAPSPPAPQAAARRARGHAESAAADPAWQPTPERFRDPRSRRVMRVWLDAAGGRHYVPEDG